MEKFWRFQNTYCELQRVKLFDANEVVILKSYFNKILKFWKLIILNLKNIAKKSMQTVLPFILKVLLTKKMSAQQGFESI